MMSKRLVPWGLLLVVGLTDARTLESFVADHAAEHDFHGVVLVRQDGEVVLHRAFGLADRAFGVANSTDTRFSVASITKLFTAVLIMKLHEQGRVDLQAPISAYLPSYRGEGADRVTLHHLLTHTSGIENFENQPDPTFDRTWYPAYQEPHTPDQLVSRFCSGPLVNEPGSRFDYSNGDFMILGRIIEAVHGKLFEQVLSEQLLQPLGLADSGMLSHARVVARLAETYSWDSEQGVYRQDLPKLIENWDAAGAMYATAGDLLRFTDALFGGRVLRAESLERLLTPALEEYAYGLWVRERELNGRPARYAVRYGRIRGARAVLVRMLDQDLTIVVLANTNRVNPGEFAAAIHRSLLVAEQ